MSSRIRIRMTVNDRPVEIDVEPQTTLLDLLREELGLTGTKRGCGMSMSVLMSLIDGLGPAQLALDNQEFNLA